MRGALADLTIQVSGRRSLRRELLRWRDLIAGVYVASQPDPRVHGAASERSSSSTRMPGGSSRT